MQITTEHARILLSAIQIGQAAMTQLTLSKLDNLSPELRAEISAAAGKARAAWDALAPEED